MQGTMSYTTGKPLTTAGQPSRPLSSSQTSDSCDGRVTKTVSENAVIVFGRRGCCMCHVIRSLLQGLGVNPPVYEIVENEEEEIIRELSAINSGGVGEGGMMELPAVFVRGKLFGGLDKVMSTHISGELVPVLKGAGALWL